MSFVSDTAGEEDFGHAPRRIPARAFQIHLQLVGKREEHQETGIAVGIAIETNADDETDGDSVLERTAGFLFLS